jgi:hypothetical protein
MPEFARQTTKNIQGMPFLALIHVVLNEIADDGNAVLNRWP